MFGRKWTRTGVMANVGYLGAAQGEMCLPNEVEEMRARYYFSERRH